MSANKKEDNIPLLEKSDFPCECWEGDKHKWFYDDDVVYALKKFKKYWESYNDENNKKKDTRSCKCGLGYYEDCAYYRGRFYCFNCWFKKCFGELPKEEAKE